MLSLQLRTVPVSVLLLSAWLVASAAQAVPENCVLTLRKLTPTEFPTVRLSLAVKDASGQPVQGLTAREFLVAEDEAPITGFSCEQGRLADERVAILLALDCSGSMQGKNLDAARLAAADFLNRLGPEDLCAVVPFASAMRQAPVFTTDRDTARAALAAATPGGWTRLYDTISVATAALADLSADRKALVLLTDGQDTSSTRSAWAVAEEARGRGVEIYTIGLGQVDRPALTRLADMTGGTALFTASADELIQCYRNLLGAIKTTYQLTYQSPLSADEAPRRTVRVTLQSASLAGRAERAYFAPRGGPSAAGADEFGWTDWGLLAGLALNLALVAAVCTRRRRRNARPQHMCGLPVLNDSDDDPFAAPPPQALH